MWNSVPLSCRIDGAAQANERHLKLVTCQPERRRTQLSTTSRTVILTIRLIRDRRTEIRQVLWCHGLRIFVDADAQPVYLMRSITSSQPMESVTSDACQTATKLLHVGNNSRGNVQSRPAAACLLSVFGAPLITAYSRCSWRRMCTKMWQLSRHPVNGESDATGTAGRNTYHRYYRHLVE